MKPISQEAALKIILGMGKPLGTEGVNIENCFGRTLAKDVISNVFSPPVNVSAMDGYGINTNTSSKNNVYYLIGEIPAGQTYKKEISKGQAVRIFTGAAIPDGVNKVIPQEFLISKNQNLVKFSSNKESFIRLQGSNFKPGFTIDKNTFLSPKVISLLASMNKKSIPVYRKANVAILSIGNELSYPGSRLANFKICSSNSYGIKAYLENINSNVYLNPIVEDNLNVIAKTIESLLWYDIVITIGGASVGSYDLVYDAALNVGAKFEFTQVNIRPGKPFKAGKIGNTIIFSLPGNAVSSLICSQLFIGPLLEKLRGSDKKFKLDNAYLLKDISRNGQRMHFMRAQTSFKYDKLCVMPLQNQDSHNLVVLDKANSLIVRAENDVEKKAGKMVKILKLKI